MPIEITMPRLSDTMETGTVIKWNVAEGDEVSSGDALADIETDKATMELESYDDGVVAKIVLGEGQVAAVGATILVLAEEGEDVDEVRSSAGAEGNRESVKQAGGEEMKSGGTAVAEPPEAKISTRTADADAISEAETNGHRIFVSPLARKIAEETGVDLSAIKGSGPSGRIVRKDVEQAASGEGASAAAPGVASQAAARATTPAPAAPRMKLEAKKVVLSNMRQTIARRLVESKTTIPHYQVTVSVRMDAILALRKQINEQLSDQGVKLSVNDFLVRACGLGMHEHPFVNSRWVDRNGQGEIEIIGDVNVGVAIALPAERGGGLVVATLRHADQLSLRDISAQTKELAEKARTRGLTIDEMSDSTFTISNLGMFGVEHFTAIINPPNAAILAVGAAVKKPVVGEDGGLAVGVEMSMTMSSDHRIVDGAMAAQYLGTVKRLLEAPTSMLV